MGIRLTPILALMMTLGVAACQEEESPAPEETTGEEMGGSSGGADTGDAGGETATGEED